MNFFFMPRQPLLGYGLLTVEASPLHSDTPYSEGILRASDWPVAENSTWQHVWLTSDTYPCPLRDSNPQIPANQWPHTHALRPRVH